MLQTSREEAMAKYKSLDIALRGTMEDILEPTCDFVVTKLMLEACLTLLIQLIAIVSSLWISEMQNRRS